MESDPIYLYSVPQRSEAWMQLRAGSVGASSMEKILTPTGRLSTQAKAYMYQLAGERILGTCEEGYSNFYMARGTQIEPEARDCFSFLTGLEVQECGLVWLNDRKRVHCSPDGLIPFDECGLEIKCPSIGTHTKYLHDGFLPGEYFAQIQGSMYVTDYPHWFFFSYYPGLPPFLLKVQRDDIWIAKLAKVLNTFCDELEVIVEQIRKAA